MIDYGALLNRKADEITERWVHALQEDEQIEATQELSYKAIRDSLPKVLEAMATILSQSEDNDVQKLVDASLEHGVVRAEQGYEPSEIAREYRILRSIIFNVLESELLQGQPGEILRAVRLIDVVIDEAIARCFGSYTEGRLRELEQLQSQLKLTNQELTRLVRASQTNLSQLAHELKTPLTSIIGYSDLFLRQQKQSDGLKDSVTNLESIERVLRSGRQLLRLINDALEISRYEAGKMPLQLSQVQLKPLIQAIVEMVEPLAQEKDLKLEVDYSRSPDAITTDPLRLQQIITNLLSNAIRYTQSGRVRLTCESDGQQGWIITVIDSGIGIRLEDQQQLFTPYFRGTLGEQLQVADSTGLGLVIVSRLVKLLQGTIAMASEPGKGATFQVRFPLAVQQPQRESS